MSFAINDDSPLFFQTERVWRHYRGGLLLDRFLGNPEPSDGHYPEDWLASTTVAMNGKYQQRPDEGLTRIRCADGTRGCAFADLIRDNPGKWLGPAAHSLGAGVGVLCKFLDSAIRLPIQCHPDRAFAREFYNSPHGKTEAWFILDTREVGGEEPYLMIGFKPGVTRGIFSEAVRGQNIPAMTDMLHKFPVEPGMAFLIPGRLPHAIGPGVFLLEIQEPTDWVVQPETHVGDSELDPASMWGPLDPETGLDCFDYAGAADASAIFGRTALHGSPLVEKGANPAVRMVGRSDTGCFGVDCLTIRDAVECSLEPAFSIGIVTSGGGSLTTQGHSYPIRRGDTFFLPHRVRKVSFASEEPPLTVYLVST